MESPPSPVARRVLSLQVNGQALEALQHVTEAVAELSKLVQRSVRLLQSEPYKSVIPAAPGVPDARAASALAAVASLNDLRAFRAATTTL